MKKIDIEKAIKNGTAPLIAIYVILFIIILVYIVVSQSKGSITEEEQNERVRSFVIEFFVLDIKEPIIIRETEFEFIATDKTYKKVEAYNIFAKAHEGKIMNRLPLRMY